MNTLANPLTMSPVTLLTSHLTPYIVHCTFCILHCIPNNSISVFKMALYECYCFIFFNNRYRCNSIMAAATMSIPAKTRIVFTMLHPHSIGALTRSVPKSTYGAPNILIIPASIAVVVLNSGSAILKSNKPVETVPVTVP